MEMAPLRFPSSIASMPHRRPVHKSARFTKGLNSESVLLIGGCYCEVGVLFLPQWKRFALYGAAATFLSAALSSAVAWDGGDFGRGPWDAGSYTYHWNPHWTFPPREHRKHKARPHDAVIARERKVSGPLLIVVSLAQQKATVFANDGEVAKTPVSTGVPGHPTPLGIFSVIQKQVYHESNLYSAAPMPYMQRITWSGVALHEGVLPGYPASHGCVRMPRDLAAEFFARVRIGTPVKVIGSTRNLTRVRRAIPIVQPGNSRYATAFSNPTQVSGSARNLVQVRRALRVVQPGRSRAGNGV